MNKKYQPTPLEQDLITAFTILYPHTKNGEILLSADTCQLVGAIGHELYISLNRHGYKIEIDPSLIKNRGVEPTEKSFFTQVHCAEYILSMLPG
jgi:hypothetical protein